MKSLLILFLISVVFIGCSSEAKSNDQGQQQLIQSSQAIVSIEDDIRANDNLSTEWMGAANEFRKEVFKRKEQSLVNWRTSSTKDLISLNDVDFEKYPKLRGFRAWHIDTITPSNWKIEYLVKNDSTILQDVYIKFSKNDFVSILYGEDRIKLRWYFTPTYLAETDNEIIMKHGCATSCVAITLVSKKQENVMECYTNVVEFNEAAETLVYVTDSASARYEDKLFQIEAINLKTNTITRLTTKDICINSYKPSCVNTIIYKENEIEFVLSLRESIQDSAYRLKKYTMKM